MERNAFVTDMIRRIYYRQNKSSKKRGHEKPEYNLSDFTDWFYSRDNIMELLDKWKESGFNIDFKPSVDRLDDDKGYSFDNIQLITFRENYVKGSFKGGAPGRKVISTMLNISNVYSTIAEAARKTGANKTGITKCCSGVQHTAGGYTWRYA